MCSLTLPRWTLLSLQEVIVDHPLTRLAALPGSASTHTLPVSLPREVEILVKSVAVPVLGLGGRVAGLASCTLTPRTVLGRVDEGALAVTRHAPPPRVCGLNAPDHSLLNAARTAEYALARDRLVVARPSVTARGHTGPATGHVTALLFLLTARGPGRGVDSLDGSPGLLGGCCCFPGSRLLWVDDHNKKKKKKFLFKSKRHISLL